MNIIGKLTKRLKDGSEAEAHIMLDTDTGEVVQCGGDEEINAEELDLISAVMNTPMPSDFDVRQLDPALIAGLGIENLSEDELREFGLIPKEE